MALHKAKSKAGKVKGKRGRPRHEGIYRQPNGQPSRAKNPPQKVALEARARLTGLNIEKAKDPRAATNIGRLCLLGEVNPADGITVKQYDAIQMYLEVVNDYKKSLLANDAHFEGSLNGFTNDEISYMQWCQKIKERYDAMQKAIAEGARENLLNNFDKVIKNSIEKDLILGNYLGELRVLCNVLHHHFNPQIEARHKNKISAWKSLAGM